MALPFADRTEAGRLLARRLKAYSGRDDVLVLGLPRGGVPVACEVAAALSAPLDLMLVRKLGVPGWGELAMGAIASGGVRVLNEDVIASANLSPETVEAVAAVEARELERRERVYRGARPRSPVEGKVVLLVDDGAATGASVRTGIAALRPQRPRKIVVALPVAPPDTVAVLDAEADQVVCLYAPHPFGAVGNWYIDFRQISDADVRDHLMRVWEAR